MTIMHIKLKILVLKRTIMKFRRISLYYPIEWTKISIIIDRHDNKSRWPWLCLLSALYFVTYYTPNPITVSSLYYLAPRGVTLFFLLAFHPQLITVTTLSRTKTNAYSNKSRTKKTTPTLLQTQQQLQPL